MAPRRAPRPQPIAIIYTRVSTEEQAANGASLAAQLHDLTEYAESRGWQTEHAEDAGVSAKTMKNRPGLLAALERLDRGEADILLATKIDRISRSVVDFAGLLDRANTKRWSIAFKDTDIDTTGAGGKFTAHVLSAAAQYERELIAQRTREGMAEKKRQGVVFGRKRLVPPDVVARIVAERAAGRSLRAIADGLNEDGVPTAQATERATTGTWRASTVHDIIASRQERA